MKIGYVTVYYKPAIGGVNRVVEELAERFVKEGHQVHVFCSDWDKKQRVEIKEEVINGVHVHRLSSWFTVANFEVIWPSLFYRLIKDNFDVIHSHEFGHLSVFLTCLASIIKKTPHVHTTHCPWSDAYRSPLGRIGLWFSYNIFTRAVIGSINKIIAITPWEINFIKKYGGRDEQIVNIPNGADNIYYKKVSNNDFKKKLGIKDKMVLFFGRYNITKSPLDFVKIAKIILSKRKDVDFVMVGPDEGEYKKVRAAAKGVKKIHILGPIRDKVEIQKMYQSTDVYLLPSYREGLPLTIFEAMACGVPIVATPVNGVPYEMKNNVNGFLVNHGDIKRMVSRVEEILNNKKLAKRFSDNNIKKAKNYSWDKIAKRTMSVYNGVIK